MTGEYAVVPARVDEDLTGSVLLGRYQILRPLGVGGMGTVYLCEHTTILKKFAVKVLSNELSQRPDHVDRFLREARASSMISHPNVVEITDFGQTPAGAPFFVMEYLDGEDLSDMLSRAGKVPWRQAKQMMLQICGALQAAHDQGIVHRDMKPGNVLRLDGDRDFVKVLDFGIAKVTSNEVKDRTLTQSGTVIGTPEYMSPEQGWGNPVDHRGDIYAMGVILFELLAGKVPFSGNSLMEILNRHMYEVPDVDGAGIPEDVGRIILKAMQKDRELRFQSMDEFAQALEAIGTGAATVQVVDEEIQTPWGQQVTARYSTVQDPDEAPQKKSMMPVFIGLGSLAVGAAVAFMMMNSGEAPAPTPDPKPVAAAVKDVDAPKTVAQPEAPPPALKQLAPDSEKVRFRITTPGIDAQILDARDEGQYGVTNDPKGVEVEKSNDALKLILRAEGYEDLAFEIVPNSDKQFDRPLTKLVVKSTKKRNKKKSTSTPPKPVETPDEPPKKTKKKSGVDSELLDPFGN